MGGNSGSHPTDQARAGLGASRVDPGRINGLPMPPRIWLTDEGSGDICWATDPDPTGDGQAEAVEYVRADLVLAFGEIA